MPRIRLFHDTRSKANKDGEYPMKIAVAHNCKTVYISLGIWLKPEQWNGEKVEKHTMKRYLTEKLKAQEAAYKNASFEISSKNNLKGVSAIQFRDLLIDFLKPKSQEDSVILKNLVKTGFENFISHKTGRTKELYESTKRRIEAYEEKNFSKLTFNDINKEWLQCFDDFMSKTAPSANSRSIHMRNLRAVFNYAIDNEITDNYPFRRFKIKSEVTRNRDLSVETLREIMKMENLEEWEVKYRDFFMLTFMLIGINVIDLCNLKEIRNGRIEYIRAKTHKLYSIKVEPEALIILEKYKGENNLLCYLDSNTNYRFFYNNLVKGLNSIRDKLKLKELTTYWARHTWATIASDLDIPDQVISLALGHGPLNPTTERYIHRNKKKIDEANRKVLDWVFYGKK